MQFRVYDRLPSEARDIRIEVFVKEQGFKDEFDSVDTYATHILAFNEDIAIATCRCFCQDDYYLIGRIAVVKEYRGRGLGGKLIEFAKERIAEAGGREIRVHAQKRAEGFYQKQGFEPFGDIDFEEGVEHIQMKMDL